MGFTPGTVGSGGKSGGVGSGFPNWMPPMFGTEQQQGGDKGGGYVAANVDDKNGSGGGRSGGGVSGNGAAATPVRVGVESRDRVVKVSGGSATGVAGNAMGMPGPRKRGRPRKYPVQA